MQLKTYLASLALALSAAGCAQAQQSSPPAGARPSEAGETISIPQPPATAWFGFSHEVRNMGRPVITGVRPGSPAAEAGLSAGDVILSVDGQDTEERLPNFRIATPGRRYILRVRRGEEEREVAIVAAPPRTPSTRP
jgi:S1-C subfamily serine protease